MISSIFVHSERIGFLIARRNFVNTKSISGLNVWGEELTSEIKLKIEDFWKDKLPRITYEENRPQNEKFYILPMFPYPSGNLHMGHVRVYTISDAVARFQRMNGKNVIHPIGWDAFGLPAENAAKSRQIVPQDWTRINITQMKSQLETLGCSFDWTREINTSDPSYYKWTQELFLNLFENGLVYQKNALVNWDPIDETVLADEQVDENGCSWRSGAKVEKKVLKQWFIRTTRFAKELLEGLDSPLLEDWRDVIKLQKHWIGECDGVNFDFKISGTNDILTLWTPHPEYIENAKFVLVKSTHSIARHSKLEIENPFNLEKIPVIICDDFEYLQFTDTFLGIPSICEKATQFALQNNINFCEIKQITDENSIEKLRHSLCERARANGFGGIWSSAKLRDWLISRQRYWGTPIPIIHCDNCGSVPVPRNELPLKLPLFELNGDGNLKNNEEWINTKCPKCGSSSKRETDTMDTFVDSSWYYLRFIDPKNENEMFSTEKARKTSPVNLYIGGKEHAVLHLYYARFISYFLHSLGLTPEKEPFKRLLVQGMVMGRSFRIKGSGKYLPQNEVKIIDLKKNKAVETKTGAPVVIAWEKMSKSKLNGVEPTEMFKEYGVDTTRLLILGDVAPTSHRNWNSNTFPGIINWQKRLWLTIQDFIKHRNNPPTPIPDEIFKQHDDYMFDSRNYYIKGTTFNYYISQQLSVAVSKQQGLTNSLRKMPGYIFANSLQFERALATQIILLAPMAPHFASELWTGFLSAPKRIIQNEFKEIDWNKSVLEQKWPETDSNYKLELICQLNGVEKCEIKMERSKLDSLSSDDAFELAIKEEAIKEICCSRKIVGTSFVLHRGLRGIININVTKNQVQTTEKDDEIAVEN